MRQAKDFTQGNIGKQIINLALPIMGTAFIQMAYNMTDILWIGHVGSGAAAAVGAAGFFLWLANAFVYTTKVGAEVTIAQSLGSGDGHMALRYARHALFIAIIMGIAYGLFVFTFSSNLVAFFHLGNEAVNSDMEAYLKIVAPGMLFSFLNPTYSGMYNGSGLSRIPFNANAIGLIINIILDPLLIYGIGPFPRMEVEGAAYATLISQGVVTAIFYLYSRSMKSPFRDMLTGFKPDRALFGRIFRIGIPVSAQSGLFAVFAMILARIAGGWGPIGVAVQSVGAQIEAISWMTASGFSTALSSFVGQNYGAKNFKRIRLGYYRTLGITLSIGLVTSLLFIVFGEYIFGFFIPEPSAMAEGGLYLRILGYSQLLMILEITTAGAFNGMGKTLPPSITGIVLNGLRIPMALGLSAAIGLSGVWWSITISSWLKGIVLFVWFAVVLLRLPIIREKYSLPQKLFFHIIPNRTRQQFFDGCCD
ncbi:MATE family efflux transporter [Tenuifilaceae bacterium CYCD]|nr:MATE family efflux transporter [Tenuifilaceae bacterium CYCD]